MRKNFLTCLGVIVFALSAIAPFVSAGEPNSVDSGAVDRQLKIVRMAAELLRIGRDAKNPGMLVSAAQLVAAVDMEKVGQAKTSEGDSEPGAETKTATAAEFTPEAILAEAAKLAEGDDAMMAVIANAKAGLQDASRALNAGGRVTNRHVHSDRVRSGKTDVYTVAFEGGKRAAVYVSGDGDTDLDLFVYDENQNLIGSDTDSTDECLVRFTPKWTGKFTIRIRNHGSVYNDYTMLLLSE